MAMKDKKTGKIISIIAGAIVLIAVAYILLFTSFGRGFFFTGKAGSALSAGRFEITSKEEINDYFVFVSADEAAKLRAESRERGEEKFLFPQVELALKASTPLIIEEINSQIEGAPFKFITVKGLPSGIKIYSSVGGDIRGDIVSGSSSSYAWVKEVWEEENNADVMLTYIPAIDLGTGDNTIFTRDMSEIYSDIGLGDQFANLLTDNSLPSEIISGGTQVAVAVAGSDGSYTKFSLKDVLTYRGRIVMIKK